ncbi:hypothetical protein HETIRDRAFT_422696 [Heterobasidion irregulare TC 32-1]|uniref:Dynein heavy chain AAA 5 extension domain-containing protein n=1 Tax=Heterobasidion irregulare (strain TC 32-1) TaxID=747525 RepID=W4JT88_HETIT|nr:uncharacterized protein HETIRDRAFT_422696 [Heterobasidion irregulare TC 32-1]ETW76106.1 hypothetical protein HETIRDRAFT_422696 [Heterobasidion irregulare TC 32-1]
MTRALNTGNSLLNKTARNILEYNIQHSDFPLPLEPLEQYVSKRLLISIIWAFSGDARLGLQAELGDFLSKQIGIACLFYLWLSKHKSLILCGSPGSGKTTTLFSALRKLPDMEVVGLNVSSATTLELTLKTFEQYCQHRKTPNSIIMAPVQLGR